MLAPNPTLQPLTEPAQLAPAKLHDVTVVRSKTYAQARVVPVPPEEFGIARNARSLREADYAFHKVMTTHSKLVGQGYDEDVVRKIPSYAGLSNSEDNRRDTVDEGSGGSDELNEPTRQIEITEHYCRLDYEGNGKPCLYKITTGGSSGDEMLLTKDGKVDIEPMDMIPIASMTPVIQTHRFFGRSIADLVMDIQRIKTALLRGVLDNAYGVNNPQTEIAESHASENTLDDLLVRRPNGIIRTKTPGGLIQQSILPIADKIFPVIEYMDATREWRTGVTRQGQGIDANALQNQSATAVNQAFTAAQARMKLIARIFAETGIRDLFSLLHATVRKHGQEKQTVQLRNKWVQVDPRAWKKRSDLTISVGLGTGDKQSQAAQIMGLMGIQKEAVAAGMTNMVTPQNVYHAAAKFTELTGNRDVEKFFTDPSTQPPVPPKPDPEMMKLQAESQLKIQEMQQKAQLDSAAMQHKAQIETLQAQADIATQDRKTQAEMAMAERKFELERELKLLDMQMKSQEHQQNAELKAADHHMKAEERKEKAKEGPKAAIEVKHGAEQLTGPLSDAISQLGEHMSKQQEAHMRALVTTIQSNKRPKRIKAPSGKVYEIED
jgi:hypothetical protein